MRLQGENEQVGSVVFSLHEDFKIQLLLKLILFLLKVYHLKKYKFTVLG